MLCPIGQSNEKPPLQALAKWREYVTEIFQLLPEYFAHEIIFREPREKERIIWKLIKLV